MKEARKAESTSPLAHEGATPAESLSLRSWCYSSATMATTSWKYGAAGRTGDQRAEDGGFQASARGMLRPRIPARSVISSRGTFLIKESKQVPKHDRKDCRSSGWTITLRFPKFLWKVMKRSVRCLFSLFPLICFSSH